MKKILITVLLLMAGLAAWGQSFKLEMDSTIPEAAAQVLQQRFTQMLEAGGFALAGPENQADGTLTITAKVLDRVDTDGSMSQVALNLELVASDGKVQEVFPIKGVGATLDDAWLRAAKQLLPRSKSAQAFVAQLK